MSSSWLDWDQTLLVPCSITSSFLVPCALPSFFLPHNSWFTCTVASLLTLLKSAVRTKTIVLTALEQVLTFKGRAVSSCVLLSDNDEQSLVYFSHVGVPVRKFLQKAAHFFFPNCTVLFFTAKLWQMAKTEGRTTWYFHPSELMLMVFIWEKQIVFCFFADRLKRYFYIWLLQLARTSSNSSFLYFFSFPLPSSLTFPFGLIWNETVQVIPGVLKHLIVWRTSLRVPSLLTPYLQT